MDIIPSKINSLLSAEQRALLNNWAAGAAQKLPESAAQTTMLALTIDGMLAQSLGTASTVKTMQALLVVAMAGVLPNDEGELMPLWAAHPQDYPDLRAFLKNVRGPHGDGLAESMISDLVGLAEVILPAAIKAGRGDDARIIQLLVDGKWGAIRECMTLLKQNAGTEQTGVILDEIEQAQRQRDLRVLRERRNPAGVRDIAHVGKRTFVVVEVTDEDGAYERLIRALAPITESEQVVSITQDGHLIPLPRVVIDA